MVEIARSKISSKYQVVIPEDVRSLLKIKNIGEDSEGYIYFYKEGEDIKIKVALVEKKEIVTFIE